MTILDGKNPRFFMAVQTADGRWMVAEVVDGKPVVDTAFTFTFDEATAIAAEWRKREMEHYLSESANAIKMKRPTLEEIAKSLGFEI